MGLLQTAKPPALRERYDSVDLREIWNNEASDFTAWLANNLDALSEALEIELEFIDREQKVDDSRFIIDIWAEDAAGGSVIIENQLEKTDHAHLGQILTYCVNMEARTVIWITRNARQEHVAVVEWLNKFSDKKFFLVELSAVRIGDSDPAPKFTVVCRPTSEMKLFGRSRKVIEDVTLARRNRRALSDTLIVPARKEGFERVFLGENAWYSVRLRATRIPQIKYIAAYQVAPIQAVTHVAEVERIEPSHEDKEKFEIIFRGPARAIKVVPLGIGPNIQGPVYCEYSRLLNSKDLAEVLSIESYRDSEAA